MDKEKKVTIIALFALLIIVIGASYAFFTAGISSEDSTTIKADAGTMKINYDGGANITLSGIYPREEAWATKVITVTGNNTTDAKMYYKLTLVVDSNTFLASDPLQYELTSTNTSTNGVTIPSITKTNITSTTIELGKAYFNKSNNARHTYQLKIYYPRTNNDQNANQGKEFSAHVSIESVKEDKPPTFAETILANNEVKTPITTPGEEINAENEALLASAEDDYGTSYYFRGAVTNNYVEFANKCWRIVRILGNGSVKLVLSNYNGSSVSNPCSSTLNSNTAAFARYSGSTYTSAFNTNYDDNAYVGFMYGTPGSSTYEATHANTNKSTILTNLETWYNNNLKTYESVIADNVFCSDKTNVTDTSYDPYRFSPNGLGYGTNVTYYGTTQRLVSSSFTAGGTGPSLKCNGDLSKITSKIGLITADELAFAGYAFKKGNTTTYLQENATDDQWWSMSPGIFDGGFDGGGASVCYVYGSSGYFGIYAVYYAGGVRPSISLQSSTNVTGEGTSENPYVVIS